MSKTCKNCGKEIPPETTSDICRYHGICDDCRKPVWREEEAMKRDGYM